MPAEKPSKNRPTRFRYTIFGLACGTSWLLYLHRYVFALIKPTLAEEWDLGKDDLGLLDSAFSLVYTGLQVPLAIAVDLLGVHILLTAMIVVWSVGLAMHAWAPSVKEMWLARVVLGCGQSAVFAALSRISRGWFPLGVRTTLQGWVGVFFGRFGGLSANLLVGTVLLGMLALPWRTAVWAISAAGLGYALLFATLFRNSPRYHPLVNAEEADLIEGIPSQQAASVRGDGTTKRSIAQMFRGMKPRAIANLLMLNAQTILSTLADNIYSAWIPLFLAEVHHLKFKEMGLYSALPLLGGAIGGATGGFLNDSMIRRIGNRRWARSGVGFAGKGLAGLCLLLALRHYNEPRTFCTWLFFVKFFSDWSLTTTWGTVTDIGGRATASVFAFNNAVAGLGAIFGPIIYGNIAEHQGWVPVFWTATAAYLLCALTWLAINCTQPLFPDDR